MRGRARAVRSVGALLVSALAVAGCSPAGPDPGPDLTPNWGVRIERTLPHDSSAFTQGLEIDGKSLIEGTGLVGGSRITVTDLATGAQTARVDLPEPLFGEGITVARSAVPPVLWQLTWRDGVAIARDPVSLAEVRRVPLPVEGWGVCTMPDGRLVTSDGSATLTFRDPTTFAATGEVTVRRNGDEQDNLNELECTSDGVYANVWQTDDIVLVDPADGRVQARIDASPLVRALGPAADSADVLNGIAAVPGTDRFLMTGKLWPSIFEVTVVR